VQIRPDGGPAKAGAMHAAVAFALTTSGLLALGRQAGWRMVTSKHADVFGLVEI